MRRKGRTGRRTPLRPLSRQTTSPCRLHAAVIAAAAIAQKADMSLCPIQDLSDRRGESTCAGRRYPAVHVAYIISYLARARADAHFFLRVYAFELMSIWWHGSRLYKPIAMLYQSGLPANPLHASCVAGRGVQAGGHAVRRTRGHRRGAQEGAYSSLSRRWTNLSTGRFPRF